MKPKVSHKKKPVEELMKIYPEKFKTPEYQERVRKVKEAIFSGRPSSYKPEYNLKIIELAKKGYTIAMIAREFNTHRNLFHQWADKYPEFKQTMEMIHEIRQAWLEEKANTHIVEEKDGPKLNTTLWNFIMSRTCKDYKEQPQTVITKTEESTIPTEVKEKLEAIEARIRNLS